MIDIPLNVVNIKKMTLDDLNLILPILTSEFDDYWNCEILKNDFHSSNSSYFIATYLDEIIGFIGVKESFDTADIMNIVIKKTFRNKKIGSVILDYIINHYTNLNNTTNEQITSIMLEVSDKNISAIKLYEKYNFKIISKRKNYYNDSDAIIMKLAIKNESVN